MNKTKKRLATDTW